MIVVIADNLPPAVRGRMKLWFIEPRPNVFISGVKNSTAERVVQLLLKHCGPESGMTIFIQIKSSPGYRIYSLGTIKRKIKEISGLQLIFEAINK